MAKKNAKSRIGTSIQGIRDSAKLTQDEFAERVGVSQSTVSALEKGDRFPTLETVYRIQEEFGVSLGRVLPDLHDGAPTPDRVAEELERLAKWARGEAVDWRPGEMGKDPPDELPRVAGDPPRPVDAGEEEGREVS